VGASAEKLWAYAALTRLWSWALIATAGILLLAALGLQAGSDRGLNTRWLGIALGVTGLTGAVIFPFLRVWLRRSALPSVYLPRATRATGGAGPPSRPASSSSAGSRCSPS
jgi:hypothetical protein